MPATYCFDNKRGGDTQVQIAGQFLDILYSDIPVEKLQPANDRDWPVFLAVLNKFKKHVSRS